MTSSASYPVYPVFCYFDNVLHSEDGGELLEALQQRSDMNRLKTTSMPRVDNGRSGTSLGRSAGADISHLCAACLPGRWYCHVSFTGSHICLPRGRGWSGDHLRVPAESGERVGMAPGSCCSGTLGASLCRDVVGDGTEELGSLQGHRDHQN